MSLKLIDRFIRLKMHQGFEFNQIEEGVLGYGKIELTGFDCSYIITEKYVNSWSSTHTIEKINH